MKYKKGDILYCYNNDLNPETFFCNDKYKIEKKYHITHVGISYKGDPLYMVDGLLFTEININDHFLTLKEHRIIKLNALDSL